MKENRCTANTAQCRQNAMRSLCVSGTGSFATRNSHSQSGSRAGLRQRCTSGWHPHADERKEDQALRGIENAWVGNKQLAVRHAKSTCYTRKQKTQRRTRYSTQKPTGKADESAKLGADMDNASRTEWPAGEMQDEREKRKGMYQVRRAFSRKMVAQ